MQLRQDEMERTQEWKKKISETFDYLIGVANGKSGSLERWNL